MQAARDLVGLVVELAPGVEDGHHDLDGRFVVLLVGVDGDPAPVVGDRNGPVVVDGHPDRLTVSRERLVYRVVDNLVDEMV